LGKDLADPAYPEQAVCKQDPSPRTAKKTNLLRLTQILERDQAAVQGFVPLQGLSQRLFLGGKAGLQFDNPASRCFHGGIYQK